MKKSLIIVVVLSLSLFVFASVASAANITLVNQTGGTIHELNVTVSSQDDWGSDLLGSEQMPHNTQITISLDTNDSWDFRALDPSGNSLSWTNLNLRGVTRIVLDSSGTANLQ